MELEQYQIVLVNLNPKIGSEIKKTKPCVIVSPDEMNKYLRTVIIAPFTSSSKKYPSRVDVVHAERNCTIALDQIRTIDKQQIVKITGLLSRTEVNSVKQVIKEMLVN